MSKSLSITLVDSRPPPSRQSEQQHSPLQTLLPRTPDLLHAARWWSRAENGHHPEFSEHHRFPHPQASRAMEVGSDSVPPSSTLEEDWSSEIVGCCWSVAAKPGCDCGDKFSPEGERSRFSELQSEVVDTIVEDSDADEDVEFHPRGHSRLILRAECLTHQTPKV